MDTTDYYSGGFFLIRSRQRDETHPFHEDDPLPDNLFSLSQCICRQHFQVAWVWSVEQSQEEMQQFGIAPEKQAEAAAWCRESNALDVHSLFHRLADARQFVNQFVTRTDDLYLIEAALPADYLAGWLQAYSDDKEGVTARLRQKIAVMPGSVSAGFEVLSYDYHEFGHSWLCYDLHKDIQTASSLSLAPHGLLQTRSDAEQALQWTQDNLPQAQLDLYHDWLLLSHSLTA